MIGCINHPAKTRLLVVRQWQLDFCSDTTAACLLSFFEYWHCIKLEIRRKNLQANAIAVQHNEQGVQDTTLLQFHTYEELREGILSMAGVTKIKEAIRLLKEKGVISVHNNPNPRYTFDKCNYYLFHPEICNAWLQKEAQVIDNFDQSDLTDRSVENDRPSVRNGYRSVESDRAITEITSKTTNEILNNNSENFKIEKSFEKAITEFLTDAGMPLAFIDPIGLTKLSAWVTEGKVTLPRVQEVLNYVNSLKGRGQVHINYLLTVLENKMNTKDQRSFFDMTDIQMSDVALTALGLAGEGV